MSILKKTKTSFAMCAAMGEGGALLLTALLLLPVAWAIQDEVLDQRAGWICAFIAAGLSVLIPTAVIVRARGRRALATGGSIALGYVVLAALCCALGGGGTAFGTWLLWLAAAVAAGGLLGAMISVRSKTRGRRRRRQKK